MTTRIPEKLRAWKAASELIQSGWNLTEPAAGYYAVAVTSPGTYVGLNFGNHVAKSPPHVKAALAEAPQVEIATAAPAPASSGNLFSSSPITVVDAVGSDVL